MKHLVPKYKFWKCRFLSFYHAIQLGHILSKHVPAWPIRCDMQEYGLAPKICLLWLVQLSMTGHMYRTCFGWSLFQHSACCIIFTSTNKYSWLIINIFIRYNISAAMFILHFLLWQEQSVCNALRIFTIKSCLEVHHSFIHMILFQLSKSLNYYH